MLETTCRLPRDLHDWKWRAVLWAYKPQPVPEQTAWLWKLKRMEVSRGLLAEKGL